jgi:hypothetical protein
MGNLSNLFVSKSFQSLIHLATDNTASATLIGLEDGFGNSIGVSVNTGGDLALSGSLTASLQQGYVWVGNASGKTTTVSTSSFGGGGGGSVNTGSLMVTGSIAGPVLTFTKGDASTFNLVIPTGSATFITGSYGAFQDDTTQSGSANVSHSIKLGTTDLSNGVYITDGTKMTVAYAGTYDIQFSAQVDRLSGSGTDEVYFWLKKNGVNVPNTTGVVTISGAALAAKTIAAWNYVIDANASDYFELVWQTTNSNIVLPYLAATGNIPAIPSVITTVTRVDVGGGNNMVTTSSFNAFTSSINSATASLFTSASRALVTASVNLNTITFTKGDGTTFPITINTGSAGGGAGFPFTGSAEITGSLGVTGSLSGFVNTLSISSNTASMNFNDGNFFTLQLVSGSITHLTATNIKAGQTINLLVKTDSGSAAASGSLTFSPTFKFAGGFDYTPTAITASQDLVSFVTFDTTQILASQIKNLS